MRLLRWTALVAALALAATGIAVAAHKAGGASNQAVSATFSAERTKAKSHDCTGADGVAFRRAHETFAGTVASETGALAGTIELRLRSLVDASGDGTVNGHFRVRNEGERRPSAHGKVVAVSDDNVLNGVLTGRVRGAGKLVANFTATLAGDTLTNGQIGAGASANTALVQGGPCHKEPKGKARGRS